MSIAILTPVERFAQANGWKVGAGFTLDLLATGKKHHGSDYYANAVWVPAEFDHCEFFRVRGRPVAVVAHNYEENADRLRAWIKRGDVFRLHEPPAGRAASWYNPGQALPQCVTRHDITNIVWPSAEEMASTAAARAARIERQRLRDEDRRRDLRCR